MRTLCEESFLLKGAQIELANRVPKERRTLNTSRPATAIPLLLKYKSETPKETLSYRPLSADNRHFKSTPKSKQSKELESSEYKDNTDISQRKSFLPSSNLLRSLLSEPLSARVCSSFNKSKMDTIDTEKLSDVDFENYVQNEILKQCALIPGLKTKPPLPVRNQDYEQKELDGVLPTVPEESELDETADNEQKQDVLFSKDVESTPKSTTYLQNSFDGNSTCDDLFLENFDEEETPVQHEQEVDYSFSNWLEENHKLVNHAKASEEQTDLFFHHLHKQVEMSENIQRDLSIDRDSLDGSYATSADEESPPKKVLNLTDRTSQSPVLSNRKKIVPKPSIKQCKPPQHKGNPKFVKPPIKDNCNDKQPKGILKTVKRKGNKESKYRESGRKSDEDLPCEEDVKSYMSMQNTTTNYLDFLNKIEELEDGEEKQSFREKILIPERDVDSSCKVDASTYDDIVSMLEILEREDIKSQRNIETMKEMVTEELSKDIRNYSPEENGSNSTTSLASSTNYNELLSYLDNVEQSCTRGCPSRNAETARRSNHTPINLDNMPRVEHLLSRNNAELAQSVVDLSLRLKEKTSGVAVLQEELSKLRKVIQSNADECERLLKHKLRVQKGDYEAIIKRHQKFIDQLIADKKSLNQQCESLISEMKMLEDRYTSNLKTMEQRHKVELQKAKEMHAIAEKAKREKWMEMKTQKIKDMTAKSIEPELQALQRRHQQELGDLRAIHRRELEGLELRAARATQQQCEALRQQLTAERESSLAHEREIVRQRFEKLVESEEKGYQEQRRRLNHEHAARMAECEAREAAAAAEKDRAIQSLQAEYQEHLEAAKRRHINEMKNIKEATALEMEAWKNNQRKQHSVKLAEMEAFLRDSCKKDRDKEIELAIDRLEQEATESRNQIEQAAENRLRRMKEKYEEELRDLEKTEQEYKNKYNETKAKLLEHEETTATLNNTIKQLRSQLDQARELSDGLSMERAKMKEQIKADFQTEISALQEEIKVLRTSKDQELQEVFTRVKLAVAKKDELLNEMSQENSALQDKCTFLENLLEQQRKEYLINKS